MLLLALAVFFLVATTWGYDTNLNDLRLKTITNSGVARNYAVTANPYQITAMTDTAAATHPWLTQAHGYAYDLADRLLTATQPTPGNNAFAYDRLDNATTVTSPGAPTVNPTYNGFNQLATWGTQTFTYDDNGNTVSGDGTKTYQWDGANRLKTITYTASGNTTSFTYDGLGRRTAVAESVGGVTSTTRHLWCGDRICQSRTDADNVTRRHYPEGEHNVTTGQKLLYRQDQLGSVRDVTDATTGNLVAAYDYGPYGNITRSSPDAYKLLGRPRISVPRLRGNETAAFGRMRQETHALHCNAIHAKAWKIWASRCAL